MNDHELAALETRLQRRFRVADTTIELAHRTIRILHPASAEELIDEEDFARDERLPYWAELWPSARALGARLLAMEGDGRTLLELGCGAGLVAVSASLAGFTVTATDYYDDALRFAAVNGHRNDAPLRGTRRVDWRQLPADLSPSDVVVASDVLYERPYGPLVARAIAAALAPDGAAFVADPGRVAREPFLEALDAHGLVLRDRTDAPYEDGDIRQTIAIFTIGRR